MRVNGVCPMRQLNKARFVAPESLKSCLCEKWASWTTHKSGAGELLAGPPPSPPWCLQHLLSLIIRSHLAAMCEAASGSVSVHLNVSQSRFKLSQNGAVLVLSLVPSCHPYDFVTRPLNEWSLSCPTHSLYWSPAGGLLLSTSSQQGHKFVFASDPRLKGYTYIILFDIFVSLQNLLRSIRTEIVILLRCLYSKLKIRI